MREFKCTQPKTPCLGGCFWLKIIWSGIANDVMICFALNEG